MNDEHRQHQQKRPSQKQNPRHSSRATGKTGNPGRGHQHSEADERRPAEADEHGLVDARALQAEAQRHRHPVHRIRTHITYIIDIQHSHAEETYPCRRQHQFPAVDTVRAYEVGPEHAHQSEKDENEDIPQPPVSVGIPAEGVFHGRPDRTGAQHQQPSRLPRKQSPERNPYHRRPENAAQQHEHRNQPLHVGNAHLPGIQPVGRPLALVGIRSAEHIPQLVAEIGKDLQADRGEAHQQHNPSAHLPAHQRQLAPQQHPRQAQRQRAQPHRTQRRLDFSGGF